MRLFIATMFALVATPAFAAESLAFKVDISLSPLAAAKLAALHEDVVGVAYYYGRPTPAAIKHADEEDRININAEDVTVDNTATSISFTGKIVKPAQISWLVNRQVRVTVNIASTNRSQPYNLLNCTIYDGTTSAAAANTPKISCKLLGAE